MLEVLDDRIADFPSLSFNARMACSTAVVISDNVISDVQHGAIVGHRWADAATGDLARIGNDGHAHLTVERNHVG